MGGREGGRGRGIGRERGRERDRWDGKRKRGKSVAQAESDWLNRARMSPEDSWQRMREGRMRREVRVEDWATHCRYEGGSDFWGKEVRSSAIGSSTAVTDCQDEHAR